MEEDLIISTFRPQSDHVFLRDNIFKLLNSAGMSVSTITETAIDRFEDLEDEDEFWKEVANKARKLKKRCDVPGSMSLKLSKGYNERLKNIGTKILKALENSDIHLKVVRLSYLVLLLWTALYYYLLDSTAQKQNSTSLSNEKKDIRPEISRIITRMIIMDRAEDLKILQEIYNRLHTWEETL